MGDEGTETGSDTSTGSNGVSKSGAAAQADARAAFLSGESETAEKPSKGSSREVSDDDSDLDDDDEESTADEEAEESESDDEDPDADLDDEEDAESADKDEDKDLDEDTKKRLDKVQRTEKRAREQLKAERVRMEADLEAKAREYRAGFDAELAKWHPRIEQAEKFEKMAARANTDPVAVLKALGVNEDRYEYIGQVFYTLAQTKSDDPEKAKKAKLAATQLMKQSEYDAEIADLKKWREDREKTEKEREEQTAADRQVNAFLGKAEKAVTDKLTLTKTLLKNDPDHAREELQIVTHQLAKQTGSWPDPKKVAIETEKRQRAKLRKLGIDPKSRGAAAALSTDSSTTTTSKKTTTTKKADKPSEKSDDKKLNPRDAFIRGEKFD